MRILLRILVIAGLAADAYLHFKLAKGMDFQKGSGQFAVSEGWLFRVQGAVAAVTGLVLLVRANRLTYALSFLVAGSAVGALLLYHYVDVGPIGPLPNMHEPVWYTDKTLTAVTEGVATVAALLGMLLKPRSGRGGRGGGSHAAGSRPAAQDAAAPEHWAPPAADQTLPPLPKRHPGAHAPAGNGSAGQVPTPYGPAGQAPAPNGSAGQAPAPYGNAGQAPAPGHARGQVPVPGHPLGQTQVPNRPDPGYLGHTRPDIMRSVPRYPSPRGQASGPLGGGHASGHLGGGQSGGFGGPGIR